MITRNLKSIRFSAAVFVSLILINSVSAQGGWVPFKISTGGGDLNTVYFHDSKRGWVGGDDGYLSRTDDGGDRKSTRLNSSHSS